MLLPCMLIDYPEFFRDIFDKEKPYPTHEGAISMVRELRPELDKYSKKVQKVYGPVWRERVEKERQIKEEKEAKPAKESA